MSNESALLQVFRTLDIRPVRGEGVWIEADDGRRYLDFYGGHAVAALGYGHPRVLQALREQGESLFFQSNLVPLDIRERAAARLAAFAPEALRRVFFVSSGAEANENALRVAFHATHRTRVVAVAGGFHGRTAGASAVTDNNASWYGFPSTPFPVTTVPFDDVDALENALGADVAALIVEPIQGMAGARECSKVFLERARRLTLERGIVLIFDEVQCGVGRSGWPFAAQRVGITPDALTTAKGLAAGFPAGALLVTEELADAVGYGTLGTTFGGGPLACALVDTVLSVIEDEDLLPRVRRLSERLKRECVTGPVVGVQGAGFLLGLRTTRPAAAVLAELRSRGILAGGSGDPNVVRLLPPLILEDEHVDALVDVLKELDP